MKAGIIEIKDEGKITEIYEVSMVEPSSVAGRKARAEENAEALRKDREAKEKERLRIESEKREKALREAYFAKWRIILVCDSLLNDWQLGDDSIDQESISNCKKKALEGESSEKLLELYDKVKETYEAIFGRFEK